MKRTVKTVIILIVCSAMGIGVINFCTDYFGNSSLYEICQEIIRTVIVKNENQCEEQTMCEENENVFGNDICCNKKIVCWGDSITYGMGYGEAWIDEGGTEIDITNWNYTETLEYYTGYDVYNLGVPGETSYEIAVREGGIAMYVGQNITVKPNKSYEITIVDKQGNSIFLEDFSGYGTGSTEVQNLVYIDNQLFQIEKRNEKLYIRSCGKQKKTIKLKKGMQIQTKAAHDIKADVLIIQMGSNGGWDSYDELVSQYRLMIEKAGTECYIIIGDTDNPTEAYDSEQYESDSEVGISDNKWETALREAFGEHFINMRTYMLEYGLAVSGCTPTEDDLEDLSLGRIPMQLKDDYTHFNSYGYYVMGVAVYEKGAELGYW